MACIGELPNGRVLVDKLPLNIIEIGLINLVFPDARVIVALRDPRDSCLSCFTQEFRLNAAMINFITLEQTAEFYAAAGAGGWPTPSPWTSAKFARCGGPGEGRMGNFGSDR